NFGYTKERKRRPAAVPVRSLHPGRIHVPPQMDGGRSSDVGQLPDAASRHFGLCAAAAAAHAPHDLVRHGGGLTEPDAPSFLHYQIKLHTSRRQTMLKIACGYLASILLCAGLAHAK